MEITWRKWQHDVCMTWRFTVPVYYALNIVILKKTVLSVLKCMQSSCEYKKGFMNYGVIFESFDLACNYYLLLLLVIQGCLLDIQSLCLGSPALILVVSDKWTSFFCRTLCDIHALAHDWCNFSLATILDLEWLNHPALCTGCEFVWKFFIAIFCHLSWGWGWCIILHYKNCYTSWNLCSKMSKMLSILLRDKVEFAPWLCMIDSSQQANAAGTCVWFLKGILIEL